MRTETFGIDGEEQLQRHLEEMSPDNVKRMEEEVEQAREERRERYTTPEGVFIPELQSFVDRRKDVAVPEVEKFLDDVEGLSLVHQHALEYSWRGQRALEGESISMEFARQRGWQYLEYPEDRHGFKQVGGYWVDERGYPLRIAKGRNSFGATVEGLSERAIRRLWEIEGSEDDEEKKILEENQTLSQEYLEMELRLTTFPVDHYWEQVLKDFLPSEVQDYIAYAQTMDLVSIPDEAERRAKGKPSAEAASIFDRVQREASEPLRERITEALKEGNIHVLGAFVDMKLRYMHSILRKQDKEIEASRRHPGLRASSTNPDHPWSVYSRDLTEESIGYLHELRDALNGFGACTLDLSLETYLDVPDDWRELKGYFDECYFDEKEDCSRYVTQSEDGRRQTYNWDALRTDMESAEN